MHSNLHTLIVILICTTFASKLIAQTPSPIEYQFYDSKAEYEALVIDELKANDLFQMSDVQSTGIFGDTASQATFSNAQVPFGIDSGLILANGDVSQFFGPNTATGVGSVLSIPGSANLTVLTNFGTIDQSSIQFSFVPSSTNVTLEYLMASEEFCDFVFTQFFDAVGVFLAGPGIVGPYSVNGMPAINIANFEDDNGDIQDVSIQTINHNINSNLYIDNNIEETSGSARCDGVDVSNNLFTELSQFDGWTVPLTASYDSLLIGEKYYLQIEIADVGDAIFGTAIYLASGGFNAGASDANLIADAGPDKQLDCNLAIAELGSDSTSIGDLYTFEWLDEMNQIISTQRFVEVDDTGQYILNVTNTLTNEIDSDTVIVTMDLTTPVASINPTELITCSNPSVSVQAVADITNPSYVWQTLNGAITSDPNLKDIEVEAAGDYELTLTNLDNGCTAVASVTVSANFEEPVLNTQLPDVLTCETTFVSLFVNENIEYAYSWANQSTIISDQAAINVAEPGEYTLTVTNEINGCTTSETITVLQDVEEPLVNIATPAVLDCGTASVLLDASASDNGNNLMYHWTDPAGNSISLQSTIEVSLCGEYVLGVTNTENGCTSSEAVIVFCDQDLPTAIINAPDLLIPGGELQLNATSSNTGANFEYLWTSTDGSIVDGETSLTLTINQEGTYCLTIFNASNNCETTSCVQVQQIETESPMADAGPDQTIDCNSPTVSLGGDNTSMGPDFMYEWLLFGNTIGNTPTIEVSTTGPHILVVTNTLTNEQARDTVSVSVSIEFIGLSISTPGLLTCSDNTATIDVFTELFYFEETSTHWETVDGNIISDPTQNTIEVDQAGIYTVVVTNLASGCTGTASVEILADADLPSLTVTASDDGLLTCVNSVITLDASSSLSSINASYQWTTNDGNIISDLNQDNIEVDQGGTYMVLVTNLSNGCTSSESIAVLEDVELPSVSISTSNNGIMDCINSIIYLESTTNIVAASANYQWTTNDGNIISDPNQDNIEVDQGGTYMVLVTNLSNGCTSSESILVLEDIETPIVSVNSSNSGIINCVNPVIGLESITNVDAMNATYEWTTTTGNIISDPSQSFIDVDDCGLYVLSVTNNENGCFSEVSIVVDCDFNIPEAVINEVPILPIGETIQLDAFGSSQGPNITYSWSTTDGNIVSGANTPAPSIDQAGTYCLKVLNSDNGCIGEYCIEVLQEEAPAVVADAGPDILINCANAGLPLTLDGSNSSVGPEFTYSWTDSNGTEISTEITVTVVEPGFYTLTVTNTQTGEVAMDSVSFLDDLTEPLLVLSIPIPDMITCEISEVTIVSSTDLDPSEAEYSWEGPGLVSDPTLMNAVANQPGIYTLTATDTSNGCSTSSSIEVTSNIQNVDFEFFPGISCEGSILLNPSEIFELLGVPGELMEGEWQKQDGLQIGDFPLATASMSGRYIFVGINPANFCELTITYNVNIAGEISVDAGEDQIMNCPQEEITLIAITTPDDNFISYVWTQADGTVIGTEDSIIVNTPGTYTIEITDLVFGCTALDTIMVGVDKNIFTVSEQVTNVTCAGAEDGSIIFEVSGGEPPYVFVGGFSEQTDLAPGLYFITIMDNANCAYETTIEITEPDFIEIDFSLNADENLEAIVSGGIPPYEYLWSTGADSTILVDPEFNTPYTLTVTDANDCVASLDIILQTNAAFEIPAEQLKVYPNPTSDYLFINHEDILSTLSSIIIVDMQGQRLQVNHSLLDKNTLKLNMQSFSPGIYFIQAALGGRLYYQKVIVH